MSQSLDPVGDCGSLNPDELVGSAGVRVDSNGFDLLGDPPPVVPDHPNRQSGRP